MPPIRGSRLAGFAPLLLAVGLTPSRDASRAAAADTPPPEFEVQKYPNLAYRTGPAADPDRHKLDLYVPQGQTDFPVLVFVHGGSWRSGNKELYAAVGRAFAKAGIGTAVVNYRLSPKVKHPAHVEDVAAAFAWTHRNIARYGGRPDRITLMGHSAGGHLVALLATDPAYLKAEGLSPEDIRGVVAVSGVYRIEPGADLTRSGFGTDPEFCERASPLNHASGKLPPFLIAYAENDYDGFDEMAVELNTALERNNTPVSLMKMAHRNHVTIIVTVIQHDDPLNRAVREFVLKQE